MDRVPPDLFLAGYPDGIRATADRLRAIVGRAAPEALERVRPGWRLIGYDLPVARRTVYFAFVAPEPVHVHLGFEVGTFLADPDGVLQGAHLKLRKVRYVTYRPGDPIPEETLLAFTREAARIARLSREERLAILMEREWRPSDAPLG